MDDDRYFTCPFDPVHRLLWIRAEKHLQDCMKRHGMAGRFQCPYNALHIVPMEGRMQHMRECKDKRAVEGKAYAKRMEHADQVRGNIAVPPIRDHLISSSEECWDKIETVSSSLPQQLLMNNKTVIAKNAAGDVVFMKDEHGVTESAWKSCVQEKAMVENDTVSVGRGSQRNVDVSSNRPVTQRPPGRGRGILAFQGSLF